MARMMLKGRSTGNDPGICASGPVSGRNRRDRSIPDQRARDDPRQTLTGRLSHEKSDGNWNHTDASHNHRCPEPPRAAGGSAGLTISAEHVDLPAHRGALPNGWSAAHAPRGSRDERPARELPQGRTELPLLHAEQGSGGNAEPGSCSGRHKAGQAVEGKSRALARRHTNRCVGGDNDDR
jgi:hypothetical protein